MRVKTLRIADNHRLVKILVFSILVVSLLVCQCSALANWVFVKQIPEGDIYINDKNIQKNKENEIFFELLVDYKLRQDGIDRVINGRRIYDTHFKPHSTKSAKLIQCFHTKTSVLGSMYFSEKMGAGKKLFCEVESNPRWISDAEIDLNTMYPLIRKIVCKI